MIRRIALPPKPSLRSCRGRFLEPPRDEAKKLERYRRPGGVVLSQATLFSPGRAQEPYNEGGVSLFFILSYCDSET